jgi:formamidopyrimidine-DNA glycosylase
MPELPDLTVYLRALEPRILSRTLDRIRIATPFLLRSVAPPPDAFHGRRVVTLGRIGKRIVFHFDGGLWAALHLMIAGRLHWRDPGARLAGRNSLAAFDFEPGSLVLTEAGAKRRASLYLGEGEDSLRALDAGGLEPLGASLEAFTAALLRENHTLKRSLTDPHLFSGIGNAYSDEILHRARLSPVALTQKLPPESIARLHSAVGATLVHWIEKLDAEAAGRFPEKVTAFREGMAVHGRYGKPCPECGSPVQRIRYADNETNYCPRCQTGGKLLADRSLSRLLREDWPRTLEELEKIRSGVPASMASAKTSPSRPARTRGTGSTSS